MKCSNCKKKEATVFYREVINGKETSWALCPDCAAAKDKEKGALLFSDMSDLFQGGLLSGLFHAVHAAPSVKEEKKCNLCGITFRQICEEGKAGCPACYSSFREEFAPTLSRLHGGATHRGRVPGALRAKKSKEDRIASLERDLKEAIAAEKFEDAAVLRDKLREMRAQ